MKNLYRFWILLVLIVIGCTVFVTQKSMRRSFAKNNSLSSPVTQADGGTLSPFAPDEKRAKSGNMDLMNLKTQQDQAIESSMDINVPQRSLNNVNEWVVEFISTALNFDEKDMQQKMDKVRPYFTPQAWQQFSNFLQTEGLISAVSESPIRVSGVVFNTPLLLFKGNPQGVYQWSVSAPVIISFIAVDSEVKFDPSGKPILKKNQSDSIQMNIRLDLSRTDPNNPNNTSYGRDLAVIGWTKL
jgi:hypothetical protein